MNDQVSIYKCTQGNTHKQTIKQMNKHVSDVHVYLYTCDTMQTSIVVANTTITIKAALSLNQLYL